MYVFESGNLIKGYDVRPIDLVFVPGDWPYLDNEAQTKNEKDWDPGLEGENLIHVGGADFWGHPTGVQTEQKWRQSVTDWKSKTGRHGIPNWGNHSGDRKKPGEPVIKYPLIGLDRILR